MSEAGSLLEIVDEMIAMVERARSVPMSASVMVNKSEMLDLLDAAREMVPDQIGRADAVLAEARATREDARNAADVVLDDAQKEAETIVAEAREQASRLVASDSITIAAKSQAARIVDEAKSQAAKLRSGANDYSQTILNELAGQLEHLQDQISAGRAVLIERTTPAAPEE
ncbi:hypothetical protein [Arcanobacterium canis]